MTLVAWETICKPRKQGGLEIKRLYNWNLAAIVKYVWWISEKKDNLWVKWVHSIYIKKQGDWMTHEPGYNTLWAWRHICQGKNILKPTLFPEKGNSKFRHKS